MDADVIAFPAPEPVRRSRNPRGSILMAAMIGLADAIGLDQDHSDEIVAVADAPTDEGGLVLLFGPLDPLD